MTDPDDLAITAFIDESSKPVRDRATGRVIDGSNHYVAAAAVTLADDFDRIRADLAAVEARLGLPLHYRKMTTRQWITAAVALADVDGWDGASFETVRPFGRGTNEHHVRAKLLEAAFVSLHRDGATRIVVEARGHGDGFGHLNKKDHDVLRRLQRKQLLDRELKIDHATKSEVILAIADFVAGARTDTLCAAAEEPFALIAHRGVVSNGLMWPEKRRGPGTTNSGHSGAYFQ